MSISMRWACLSMTAALGCAVAPERERAEGAAAEAGIALCTGDLSARQLGIARACLRDDGSAARVWLVEAGGQEEVPLAGRVEKGTWAQGSLTYDVDVDLHGAPGSLGALWPSYARLWVEVRLRPRDHVRAEGALSDHWVGDLERTLVRADGSSEALEPIEDLHFYAIDHDGHHPHWSYEAETGPEHWGTLGPENEACFVDREVARQSPITLDPATALACGPDGGIGSVEYGPSRISLLDNGHTILASVLAPGEVSGGRPNRLVADGRPYDLLQWHVHAPSEHVMRGSPAADLEVHFVHKSPEDGSLAVLGVLVSSCADCEPHADLARVLAEFPAETNVPRELAGVLDPAAFLPPADARGVLAYDGSLTTPPCSEGVHWYVMARPVPLAAEQVELVRRRLAGDNARPVAPLQGRTVRACP